VAILKVSRILLSEWFGFSLAVLMVACLAMAVHDDRPATEIEQTMFYLSFAIVIGWFITKGWSIWSAKSEAHRP
jgi:hypothetical protein